MSEELKPCPFCGGEARAFRCEESGTFDVQCQQCGAIPFIGSRTSERKTMADVIAAWNARAAVTDEQFSLAVHDGRVWQVVRECHMVSVSLYDEEGVDGIECDECGWSDVHEWYDPMPEFCPECGAKVAPC